MNNLFCNWQAIGEKNAILVFLRYLVQNLSMVKYAHIKLAFISQPKVQVFGLL